MAEKSDRQIAEELAAEHEPALQDAFFAAINGIVSLVVLRVLVERMERGDIEGAIDALHLDPVAFDRFERRLLEAYVQSGQASLDNLPRITGPDGNRVVFRFGVRNPEAENWLQGHSSELVTRIVDDQREAVRQHLTEGLEQGRNPRQTALDVAGRVNRATGRREGGVIGLTAAQERYVASARQELLSGDPEALRNYLTRARRDKRFDRAIAKALREERPLDQETVNRIVGRYSSRLLALRAETIARTETMAAINTAKVDAIRRQISEGKIEAQDVTKVWHATADLRTRDTHRSMNGRSVGLDEAFISPSGASIRYPGDPQAPASEIVACRCWLEISIDHLASVVRRQRAD